MYKHCVFKNPYENNVERVFKKKKNRYGFSLDKNCDRV